MPYGFFLLTVSLLFYLQIAAQQPFYRNINISEGLSSSETYCVLQDSKGYIWVSSDGGVCRFDGRSFTCYTVNEGLPDNTVFDLVEDNNGRIWMTCFNGSICYYANGKIHRIAAEEQLKQALGNGKWFPFALAFDAKGALWLGTTRSLYKILPDDNYGKLTQDQSFGDSIDKTVMRLDNGNVIGSSYHLAVEHIKKFNPTFKAGIKTDKGHIYRLDLPRTGPVYAGFEFETLESGTILFSVATDLISVLPDGGYKKNVFPSNIVFIRADGEGNLWIGLSKGGIHYYEGGDLDKKPLVLFDGLSVSGMCADHEGGFWFTTLEKGLFYLPFFNYYRYYNVPGLCERITGTGTISGTVYAITYKNELFAINEEGKVKHLSYHSPYAASGKVVFYPVNGRTLLCGSNIAEIDTAQGATRYYFEQGRFLTSGGSIVQWHGKKSLMVAQNALFEIEDGKILYKKLLPSRATGMLRTSDGSVLLSTISGLYVMQDTAFVPYKGNAVLQNVRITSLAEDKEGRLYVSTHNRGVFILKDGRWLNITYSSGLASNLCHHIFPDSTGVVWVGTNKGISYFHIGTPEKVKTINISNGLPTNEVTSLTMRGDLLYAGTREGLCVINTRRHFENKTPPLVRLEGFYVNNEPVGETSDFDHDQNDFRLHADCITYKSLFRPVLKYRLSGVNDTWVATDESNIEFLNLQPGKYGMEIYGMNNNGLASIPVFFSFTISKPWWNQWWFILLEAMTALATVALIIRWQVRKVRRQEKEKTAINKVIAEYRIAALRAQMNPHFIFNAINSIQSFILKSESQQAYNYLAKFSKLIRLVLNVSKENFTSLENEISILALYIELEQLRFSDSFDFILSIDPGIEDPSEVMVPTMLIQPYIENAIWHGIMPLEYTRKGVIEVAFTKREDNLVITIRDNGVGREQSGKIRKKAVHHSMGMLLVREKLDLLIGAEKQKSIMLTDLYTERSEAAGTKVEIVVPFMHDHL